MVMSNILSFSKVRLGESNNAINEKSKEINW